MKRNFYLFTIVIICFHITVLNGQEIRPVKDDVGYSWDLGHFQTLVEFLREKETINVESGFIAAISPHDDYLYAAQVYYPLFRALKTKEVVIFGVTHGTVRKEIGDPQNLIILDQYREWKGPRHNVKISPLRDFISIRLDSSFCKISNKAHELEHSIEGLVPFLQYFNPEIKITPIMVTMMSFDRIDELSSALATIISDYIKNNEMVLGKDILFLVSSDANHYGKDFNNIPFGEDESAHQKGIEQDIRIANDYLSGSVEPEKIREFTKEINKVVWCGKFSIPMGLMTAKKTAGLLFNKGLNGKIIRYADTFTSGVLSIKGTGLGTTAPFSLKHWVGFLSAAYYLK